MGQDATVVTEGDGDVLQRDCASVVVNKKIQMLYCSMMLFLLLFYKTVELMKMQ